MRPGEGRDLRATNLARLCRIAGTQGMLGDLAAGLETAALRADDNFRACALALSGHLHWQDRLHCAGKS
jgi:hypothetical protein